MGTMSGLPYDTVNRLLLKTESNSTGFAFQPTRKTRAAHQTMQQEGCFIKQIKQIKQTNLFVAREIFPENSIVKLGTLNLAKLGTLRLLS